MADIKVRKHPIINHLKQESKTPIVNEQSDILEELEDLEKIQRSSSNQTKTLQELEQAQKAHIEYIAFSGGELRERYIPELMRQQKKRLCRIYNKCIRFSLKPEILDVMMPLTL